MSRSWGWPLGVALAALLGSGGAVLHDFVWDDTLLIQRSYRLRQWSSLPAALGSHFWAEAGERSQYYRPVVTLSFFLDLQLWGTRPFGFHLTNVLAHLAATLALWRLARRLTGSHLAAFAAGALFAVHPLHSESVAFVSGRTDILAALFFVLAFLGYVAWRESGRVRGLVLSVAGFLLALGSKEVAVTLPAALAAYDWAWRGDLRTLRAAGQALPRYAPYGAAILAYGMARAAALGGILAADGGTWGDLPTRVLTSLRIAGSYVWLALIPYPSTAYHWIVPDVPPPGPGWWLPAAVLAGALALTGIALRRSPPLGFGAAWFWITLIPSTAVNVLPLPAPIMAERFLYLPTAGSCLLLGMVAARLLGAVEADRAARVPAAPALGLALLLLVYAGLLLWRNEDWKDDYRLYLRMVETSPEAPLPRVNLAFTQIPRGEVAAARAHLEKALELAPRNARALVGLGLTQTVLGEPEPGIAHALKGYALEPGNANIVANVGTVYLFRDEPARALPYLEESLKINPHQPSALLNLALALSRLGRQAEAEAALAHGAHLSRLMTPESPLVDRVSAEVLAARSPREAAAAWERYIARLRADPEAGPRHRAELAHAEERLARLRSAAR